MDSIQDDANQLWMSEVPLPPCAESEERGLIPRQEIWLRAWCAVASASNVYKEAECADWADACLKDFDSRFPNSAT